MFARQQQQLVANEVEMPGDERDIPSKSPRGCYIYLEQTPTALERDEMRELESRHLLALLDTSPTTAEHLGRARPGRSGGP